MHTASGVGRNAPAADPQLEKMRALVSSIHQNLERMLAPRAARLGCSREESSNLVIRAAIGYFRALGEGCEPPVALEQAMDAGELGLLAWRLEQSRARGESLPQAFLAQLELMLDATDARESAAIEAARAAFNRLLEAGSAPVDAITHARAAARAILAVGEEQAGWRRSIGNGDSE